MVSKQIKIYQTLPKIRICNNLSLHTIINLFSKQQNKHVGSVVILFNV